MPNGRRVLQNLIAPIPNPYLESHCFELSFNVEYSLSLENIKRKFDLRNEAPERVQSGRHWCSGIPNMESAGFAMPRAPLEAGKLCRAAEGFYREASGREEDGGDLVG